MKSFVVATVAMLAACGYGEDSVQVTIPPDALSVPAALEAGDRKRTRVHGYFVAPRDDVARLCPQPSRVTCYPQRGLVVEGVSPTALPGVEKGCCAIGFYTENEVVLGGSLSNGTLFVEPKPVTLRR